MAFQEQEDIDFLCENIDIVIDEDLPIVAEELQDFNEFESNEIALSDDDVLYDEESDEELDSAASLRTLPAIKFVDETHIITATAITTVVSAKPVATQNVAFICDKCGKVYKMQKYFTNHQVICGKCFYIMLAI